MPGWWSGSRDEFLSILPEEISNKLSGEANREGWDIESEQKEEWDQTIGLLQSQVFRNQGVEILREALASDKLSFIHGVILEFNFKRRGIRIDAILIGGSNVFVVEFKRSKLTSGDHDQVVNYCINLVEFHDETQKMTRDRDGFVIPILVSRKDAKQETQISDLERCYDTPWSRIPRQVTKCHGSNLRTALEELSQGLTIDSVKTPTESWNHAPFSPSSTIVDAALSLYGDHDVSAIYKHSSQMKTIQDCTDEIRSVILDSRSKGGKSLIFMSGSPGAGKTLVGLNLVFSQQLKDKAVFMTGNAPLVEVLQESLKRSYNKMSKSKVKRLTGYTKDASRYVTKNTVFKIVKAHHFLKPRDKMNDYLIESTDGDILVIDEAQRTYKEGRMVIGEPLPDHEANMITKAMEIRGESPVIVLLIGQNQNINRGERGAVAWLEAAEKFNWDVFISDQTLSLSEFSDQKRTEWSNHKLRKKLQFGHLSDSIRHYRNTGLERWVHYVMTSDSENARNGAVKLHDNQDTIWITRSLKKAKSWTRSHRVGEQRAGIIASGKGGRLPAEGLFPTLKPKIANWMLEPSGDIRSSNMLETVQNQFQIQGLELDYTIVCWDADLRRENERWVCYDLSGSKWNKMTKETDGVNTALQERKNGYRVLLTRARKGMVIFVPKGDLEFDDLTRNPEFYNGIYEYLTSCGAKELAE